MRGDPKAAGLSTADLKAKGFSTGSENGNDYEDMASLFWLFVLVIGRLYTFGMIITQGANDWRAPLPSEVWITFRMDLH